MNGSARWSVQQQAAVPTHVVRVVLDQLALENHLLDLPRGYESFGECHLFHRMGQVEDTEPSCCPDGVEDGSHGPMLAWRMDSEGPEGAER